MAWNEGLSSVLNSRNISSVMMTELDEEGEAVDADMEAIGI